MEKFTTAELKRFCSVTCKSLNYCECFLYEKGKARIYWWKEGTYSSPTHITRSYNHYFLSQKSFSEHLTLLPIFGFWLLCSTREKKTPASRRWRDISNVFITDLHKLFICLVILEIIPKFLVPVGPGNRGTICLCIFFDNFILNKP